MPDLLEEVESFFVGDINCRTEVERVYTSGCRVEVRSGADDKVKRPYLAE
jgi:hypothetical protein